LHYSEKGFNDYWYRNLTACQNMDYATASGRGQTVRDDVYCP
jgi:hypothetical protein